MEEKMTFGKYLHQLRGEKSLTMRRLSERIDLSMAFLSDVENDRRYPPGGEKLRLLIKILDLNEEQREKMYDLAGNARKEVSPDLLDYIMDQAEVRVALRTARDVNLKGDDWLNFAERIKADQRE